MKRIHIIGRKNSGKTTLIAELVDTFVKQGIPIGTIKHTHHQHELDTPGKDSHRHRAAGAAVVGILSPQLNAVFFEPNGEHDSDEQYARITPMFAGCALVLVEGHSQASAPKVEVWRAAGGQQPMALDDASILAVVTDDCLDIGTPVLPRGDVASLAARLRAWAAP